MSNKAATTDGSEPKASSAKATSRADAPTAPPTLGLSELAQQLSGGYRSVGTMVYDILRDAILSGTLAPGQKLRQETLADAIGVSRVPVRSALIQLESDGLVEVHDRRGATVKTLSRAQAEEIYSLRTLLETYALRHSMTTMTPERLDRLRELAEASDMESEGAEFVAVRSQFYGELYDSENHPLLWEIIEDLRLKVGRYVLGWRLFHAHANAHSVLADVVAKGDVEAAVAALEEHLQGVRDGVLSMLESDDEPQESAAPSKRRR